MKSLVDAVVRFLSSSQGAVALAYGAIWLLVFLFILRLWRKSNALEAQLRTLRQSREPA